MEYEFTLNSPITKEDFDKLADVELDNTPSVLFETPKGRQVRYIKCDVLAKIKAEVQKLQTYIFYTGDEKKVELVQVLQVIDDVLEEYKK